MKKLLYIIPLALLLVACGSKPQKKQQTTLPQVQFSADSAYQYIAEQVSFGPRVPQTTAHRECVQYLQQHLRQFGFSVELQQGQLPDYEGKPQQIVNIIGHWRSETAKRVLLAAHYDSRPWADQEENYDERTYPILGANDGASGVGVLLEIARQLQATDSPLGVDIIFFDCEDMGTPDFYTGQQREDTWCLGSQLWSKETEQSTKNKDYRFGIVLDMVGGKDAIFPREYYSMGYAEQVVERVWRTARHLGYAQYFRDEMCYPITDDHYYINELADIPCIDIIHYDQRNGTGFADYWHTHEDDMRNISQETLEVVGRTILTTLATIK